MRILWEKIKYASFPAPLVYLLITIGVVSIPAVKLLVFQWFGIVPFPYLTHFFIIVLGAWFGGLRGGIIATVGSALLIWYVLLPPELGFLPLSVRNTLSLLVFTIEGLVLSLIVSKLRLSRSHLFALIEELQKNQERLQLLIDNAKGYALFFLNREGLITDWNDGAERLFGYTAAEVINQPLDLVFPGVPSSTLFSDKAWKKTSPSWNQPELPARCKNGNVLWSSLTITPLKKTAHSVEGFGVVCHDLTPLKELDIQREQFLNDISHELKTPLTSLKLWVDLLSRKQSSDSLVKLQQHTQKLAELINTLLDLNQIQSGTFRLQLQSQPVSQVVQAVQGAIEQAHFVVMKPEKLPAIEVLSDLPRVRMATSIFAQNLVNAMRAVSGESSSKLGAKIELGKTNTLVCSFTVPGMTAKIIEPFIAEWKKAIASKRILSNAEKSDSKAYFAAHVLKLHGHNPVITTKVGKVNQVVMVLTLKFF